MAQLLTYEDIQAALSRLSSVSGVNLRPGLGVFLERPKLWNPEAKGWRILVDVNPLDDGQQNRLEDAVRGAGLRWRKISRGGLVLLEIHVPQSPTLRELIFI